MTGLERRALMERVVSDTRAISKRFGLRGFSIRECAKSNWDKCQDRSYNLSGARSFDVPMGDTCWACCEGAPGDLIISVRLFNRRNGRALNYPSIADSICHELAHVACWNCEEDDHGPEWRRAFERIAGWARAEEILDIGPEL